MREVRLGEQWLRLTGAAAAMMLVVPLLAACGSSSSNSSSSVAVNSVVNVTIHGPSGGYGTAGEILFTPKTVKRGSVTFKVINADSQDHVFSINGAQSAFIAPGGKGIVIKVTFAKRGVYSATCPDEFGLGGLLTVN